MQTAIVKLANCNYLVHLVTLAPAPYAMTWRDRSDQRLPEDPSAARRGGLGQRPLDRFIRKCHEKSRVCGHSKLRFPSQITTVIARFLEGHRPSIEIDPSLELVLDLSQSIACSCDTSKAMCVCEPDHDSDWSCHVKKRKLKA